MYDLLPWLILVGLVTGFLLFLDEEWLREREERRRIAAEDANREEVYE